MEGRAGVARSEATKQSLKKGEESEAWNRAAFDLLGQKRRVFETPSLSHNMIFHHRKKIPSLKIIHLSCLVDYNFLVLLLQTSLAV